MNLVKSRLCVKCKDKKPEIEFYKHSGRTTLMQWCKECIKNATAIRQKINKERAVSLLGGKCARCGYSKYIGALEFHHLDRKTKNVSPGRARSRGWKRFFEEVKKCILLCANCHREEEDKILRAVRISDNALRFYRREDGSIPSRPSSL